MKIFNSIIMIILLFVIMSNAQNQKDIKSDTLANVMRDIDGNEYKTVKIGNQWWMAENLKVTHYNNGDAIPNVTDEHDWTKLSTGAYCSYDNNDSNIVTYGLLYNWYAVDDDSIAPAGWHVPTNEEWTELANYLIDNGFNYDSTTKRSKIGKSMAAKTGWNSSKKSGAIGNDMPGNNASGFSALPGGLRNARNGKFVVAGRFGHWWSSTENNSTYARFRLLRNDNSALFRYDELKENGFSVRLIKD